jgi:hypothetical protein
MAKMAKMVCQVHQVQSDQQVPMAVMGAMELMEHPVLQVHLVPQVQPLLLQSCQQVQDNLAAVVVELSSLMQPEQLLMHATELPDQVVADHLQRQLFPLAIQTV